MISTIGNLRGHDLGADDDRQLGEDQVRLGDVLGGVGIRQIAEGLALADAIGLLKDGVDLLLTILEQGFELGRNVEALGRSGSDLGDRGLEVLGLLRGVDASHNFRSEHANRLANAPSAEHGRRILGPPRTGFGGKQASKLSILDGEPDLAGVSIVGEESDSRPRVKLLPENLATTGAVSGEHGIGAHGERTIDDVVLALEVERSLAFSSALPSDEFALFEFGTSQHPTGSYPLAHLLDGGDGVRDLVVHLGGWLLRCRCDCVHWFCRSSSSITSERTRIVRLVALMAGSLPPRIHRRTVSG